MKTQITDKTRLLRYMLTTVAETFPIMAREAGSDTAEYEWGGQTLWDRTNDWIGHAIAALCKLNPEWPMLPRAKRKLTLTCPNDPSHTHFTVGKEILVNQNGEFLEELDEDDISEGDNPYACHICGCEAEGSETEDHHDE